MLYTMSVPNIIAVYKASATSYDQAITVGSNILN